MMIPSQRHLFDIPREIAWLNCAYMSPLSHSVVGAGTAGLLAKAHPWGVTPDLFFRDAETLRGLYARLIGASANDIAITPSVSYGMAVAALNAPLKAGQNIVILDEEFPSGVYGWREAARRSGADIRVVSRPENGDWTAALLNHIDDGTAVVCTGHTHWICGGMIDVARISRAVKAVGGALVLDITQSGGALPFDVAAIDPDFVCAAGYKCLMGPYSLGFLYVAPRHQAGVPLEHNWISRKSSEDLRRLIDYQDEFQPGARRFDVGERSNFALVPAAIAATRQLLDWGVENTAETLGAMTAEIATRAENRFGAEAIPSPLRAPHYLGLRFPCALPDSLLAGLAARNVYVSLRGDRLRVTPHLYNDAEDIDRLFDALEALL